MHNLFFQRPFKTDSYKRVWLWLIIINFALFFLSFVYPDIEIFLGLCPINLINFKMYWQFFTYMFMHANMRHIFFNMLALLFFGVRLEKTMGSKEFLLFYLICGTVSGILSFAVYYYTGTLRVMLIGASGAIYAILFCYAVLFPRSVFFIWGIIPVPAPILILVYTIIEVFSQLTGYNSGVGHLCHLFGFLAAFLYFIIRMKINPFKVWKR